MNRLECVGEILRHTLNEPSRATPDWLRAQVPAEWGLRYGRRFEQYHLPKTEGARRLPITQGAQRVLNGLRQSGAEV